MPHSWHLTDFAHALTTGLFCESLPEVTHGQWRPHTCGSKYPQSGQTCHLVCDSGYKVTGQGQEVCTGENTWKHNGAAVCEGRTLGRNSHTSYKCMFVCTLVLYHSQNLYSLDMIMPPNTCMCLTS